MYMVYMVYMYKYDIVCMITTSKNDDNNYTHDYLLIT